MITKQIQINNLTIEVTKKKIKNLHLKIIRSDGSIRVSAPFWMSMAKIQAFILSKWEWIQKQQLATQTIQAPLEYIQGEAHWFFGKPYELCIVSEKLNYSRVVLKENQFCISSDIAHEKRKPLLEHWYKEMLQEKISPLIAHWEPIMNVKVTHFSIRKMKTRWGSCSYRTGRIRFNLELAKKPIECIEYVVVHELVHLLEASHNHRFVALMDQFLPAWRNHRKALNSKLFSQDDDLIS